jgi:hypothetical protein
MRACRHCSHENADHLAYCSRCGRRLQSLASAAVRAGRGVDALASTAAVARTMFATPAPARPLLPNAAPLNGGAGGARTATPSGHGGPAPGRPSGLRWVGDSIGYIYVYTRGKLDAGERRRRLGEERDGAEAMLAGAIRELGATILREGIQHGPFTALIDAIKRAEVRRETAAGDIVASEKQKESEDARLAAQEDAAEAEWKVCDAAARDADEVLRKATAEHEKASAKLSRLREERARLMREADAAAASPDGRARAARLRHEGQGLATEQRTLGEQVTRLERQLTDLREKSASLRAESARTRSKADKAATERRQAASDIAASIAGHVRDRAEADREAATLTEQLGRTAAESSARLAASPLLSVYQRIDRLSATIGDRTRQIAALDQAAAHYDLRKLLTGVGLLTSMLLATAAALWAALR